MAFYVKIHDLEGNVKSYLRFENKIRAHASYKVICASSPPDSSEIIKLMDENFVTLKSNVGENEDREGYC